MAKLKAVVFNCTLKPSGEKSSTHAIVSKVVAALSERDVECRVIHAVSAGIKIGNQTDMGEGDAWPAIHEQLLNSNIIVIGTPIWFAQRGSVCQIVLERINAMLNESNAKGQYPLYGKVAGVCVVGNEDGAQQVSGSVLYDLMQVGATIPPNAEAYWVGTAGTRDEYADVAQDDEYVNHTIARMAGNLVFFAKLLQNNPIQLDENTAE